MALVTAEVRAEVTMKCAKIPVTVSPAPFIETGTGWFVDGRGYVITNAHVVDPVHRLPPWVTHELKKKAIDQACVDPVLKAKGLCADSGRIWKTSSAARPPTARCRARS